MRAFVKYWLKKLADFIPRIVYLLTSSLKNLPLMLAIGGAFRYQQQHFLPIRWSTLFHHRPGQFQAELLSLSMAHFCPAQRPSHLSGSMPPASRCYHHFKYPPLHRPALQALRACKSQNRMIPPLSVRMIISLILLLRHQPSR